MLPKFTYHRIGGFKKLDPACTVHVTSEQAQILLGLPGSNSFDYLGISSNLLFQVWFGHERWHSKHPDHRCQAGKASFQFSLREGPIATRSGPQAS